MKGIIYGVLVLMLVGIASAALQLDRIQYDPAIIAAGDEVDIVVEFHQEGVGGIEDRLGNPDYTFRVLLEPDDTLTKGYVIIQDAEGDDLRGTITSGENYNKRFRVKVLNNAPAGNYEFKLTAQWYKDDKALEGAQYLRFRMPVKREGIILDISTITTVPSEVRPGDNFVEVKADVANVGQKDAKSVEINLALPLGLESSYTNANRVWIGSVNKGESKEVTFFLDVDDSAESKEYTIGYDFSYMDLDDNSYTKSRDIPFLVKPRPYLEVYQSEGFGLAGGTSKLYIKVKNTGTESAEAVDVRILKQNSQPFTLDVRSDYIGELEPGEEGLAVFDINVNSDAEIKEHDLKLLIRSKGDSDEGDDNIYTYNRRAKFDVTGKAPNNLVIYGLIGAGVVVLLLIGNSVVKKSKKKGR